MIRSKTHGQGPIRRVLLHDWTGDHRSWDATLPYLDGTSILADLRGYGLSKDEPGTFSLDEAARDIVGLLESEELTSIELVGHSMSTLVAQQAAVWARSRLARLILVAPVAPTGMNAPPEIVEWLERVGQDPNFREEQLKARFVARYGEGWARHKFKRWLDSSSPEACAGYVKMFASTSLVGDPPTDLPVLALVGSRDDEPFTGTTVQKNLGGWEQLRLRELESAGHYPMEETPPSLAHAMQASA